MKGIFAIVLLLALVSCASATEIESSKPDYSKCISDIQQLIPIVVSFIQALIASPFDIVAVGKAVQKAIPIVFKMFKDCDPDD